MNRRKSSLVISMAFFATLFCVPGAWCQSERVLFNFGGPGSVINTLAGANPYSGLVFDSSGNLYGTTAAGGIIDYLFCQIGCGTTFELTPNGSGGWKARYLYLFRGYRGNDGAFPTSPIIFDEQGNLYGTSNCPQDCASFNGGVVYQLSPNFGGNWTFSVLYGFAEAGCVGYGSCSVAFDPVGHLYGSELFGFPDCPAFAGEIIALDHSSSWYRLVVHCFGAGGDGEYPTGALTFDSQGNIYGATGSGGSSGVGTVYKLAPNPGSAHWTEAVLYSFQGGSDGANPGAGVVFDAAGNIYGTTSQGGSAGMGIVFKLTPQSNGSWSESVLYSFQGGNDASNPNSSPTFDAAGALYGTAGGGASSQGTVFKLTPSLGGQWTESVVYAFTGGLDGGLPFGGVTIDSSGNLYGTASVGGTPGQNGGVAFEITP